MDKTKGAGTSIPRLQELSFLEEATKCVAEDKTFDEIRQALITHMISLRDINVQSGNHAIFQNVRKDPHRYFSNAAEALLELMRLGFVERSTVPSTKTAVEAYQQHRFRLTPKGEYWANQFQNSRQMAYDVLFRALWQTHPQFSGYLNLLARGMFVVPTARWTEVSSSGHLSESDRPSYMQLLAARAFRAVEAGVTGWRATEDEIMSVMRSYLEERITVANQRQRPVPYPRNQDFVNACEEALVNFSFRQAGIPIDYISHEILRRWTKHLGVANFSYHVPAASALRLWATAELVDDEGGVPTVRRRGVGEWGDRVINVLPDAYELARKQEPGNSWVPIYRVRAAVCFKLGLNDPVFDAAVRQFLARERMPNAMFRLNLDRPEFGNTPPSELPLQVVDTAGRAQTYRVMTLIPL